MLCMGQTNGFKLHFYPNLIIATPLIKNVKGTHHFIDFFFTQH